MVFAYFNLVLLIYFNDVLYKGFCYWSIYIFVSKKNHNCDLPN